MSLILLKYQNLFMLFANKTGGNQHSKSKTPQKGTISGNSTTRLSKKEGGKFESGQK